MLCFQAWKLIAALLALWLNLESGGGTGIISKYCGLNNLIRKIALKSVPIGTGEILEIYPIEVRGPFQDVERFSLTLVELKGDRMYSRRNLTVCITNNTKSNGVDDIQFYHHLSFDMSEVCKNRIEGRLKGRANTRVLFKKNHMHQVCTCWSTILHLIFSPDCDFGWIKLVHNSWLCEL